MMIRYIITAVVLLVWGLGICLSATLPNYSTDDDIFHFTILHTNDLHSRVQGGGPDSLFRPGGGDPIKGHFARLAYKIKDVQKKLEQQGEPYITLDGGDFYSGSLFHTLGVSPLTPLTPELEFFSYCNYTAVSLGNHEFDAYEKNFKIMVEKAATAGLRVPLVTSNLYFKEDTESSLREYFVSHGRVLASSPSVHLTPFVIKDLFFQERARPLRVGILGIVGPDAAMGSLSTRVNVSFAGYDDERKKMHLRRAVKSSLEKMHKMVEELDVNVVVLTTHMGDPEDDDYLSYLLPLARDHLDVVVAGHTHNVYYKQFERTIISQTGAFGENLGVLHLSYSFKSDRIVAVRNRKADTKPIIQPEEECPSSGVEGGRTVTKGGIRPPVEENITRTQWNEVIVPVVHFPITSDVPADKFMLVRIEEYMRSIRTVTPYLKYAYNEQIYDKALYDPTNVFHEEETEMSLAIIACTGILAGLRKSLHSSADDPIQFYFMAPGMIRSEVQVVDDRVTLQFSDVFRMLAMGFDEEGRVGFPIVDFYLGKGEIALLVESISLLQQAISPLIGLAFSDSVSFATNPWGIPFINRMDLSIDGVPYKELPDLLHVATNSFLAGWLCRSPDVTFGLVSVLPKDKYGRPLGLDGVRGSAASPREFDMMSIYLQSL